MSSGRNIRRSSLHSPGTGGPRKRRPFFAEVAWWNLICVPVPPGAVSDTPLYEQWPICQYPFSLPDDCRHNNSLGIGLVSFHFYPFRVTKVRPDYFTLGILDPALVDRK